MLVHLVYAIMTHTASLLWLILTSSLLTWTSTEASISCIWTKVSSGEEVHYSFLRSDPRQASPSLRLYHTVWSPGRALLGCSWSDHDALVHNYVSLCRERPHEFSDRLDNSLTFDSMFDWDELCVSVESAVTAARTERTVKTRTVRSAGPEDGRSEVKTHRRVKRGFIVPGTLWCGSGNKAPSYTDLGVFEDTDRCCREHDQCKYTILSFHSQFGVFNTNIFTMSHCDCDNKFRSCLTEANDSISDVVGYTFFNLLKMHCFEFSHKLQCTQRNWFGMCKETKMALYAEVHPPILYESVSPTEAAVINANTSSPAQDFDTIHPLLFSNAAAASTVPTLMTGAPPASITPHTHVSTTTKINTPDDLDNTLPPKEEKSCDVYKDLDECRSKILPLQKRYGLCNPEPRTMYHCNCTSRLFQTLAKQAQLTEVQAVLLEHVSLSCFLPQDCTSGRTCTAVLVRAELPQVEQRGDADVEEQHHLQAVRLKVRRPNLTRAKRKDGAVRLHKLCRRMVLPKLNKRKHLKDTQQPAV
ncbi:group 3 secretory phospholipase A2 [Sphaeramia orbicularis]|uniref:group 3 secretory phospholipase A2 n=1 Tax=Sphaeramia orbicularis TaxID=375764 RepID=UPI00117E6B17|nr:group 3 secretory phospholipase A2-like [Sphaeramia orbicularis]